MPAKDYFYYIDTLGYCSNGDFQLPTQRKPNYANICAWKPSLPNVVYGCDAKDGICWTTRQACSLPPNPGNSSLEKGLQSCVRPSGEQWCCRDYPVERCGITDGEPFLCWANDLDDDNPMRGAERDVARNRASAKSILKSMSLTISSPTAVAYTTIASRTSIKRQSSASLLTSTSPAPAGISSSNDKAVSAGAIAGIIIGSIVLLGLVISGVICIMRRRKQRSSENQPHQSQAEKLPSKTIQSELSNSSARHELGLSSGGELPGTPRYELPS